MNIIPTHIAMLIHKFIVVYVGDTNTLVKDDCAFTNDPPKYLNKYELVNGNHLNAIVFGNNILHVIPPK